MGFEQRLNEIQSNIAGNSVKDAGRQNRTMAISIGAGLLGGIGLAYKRHKGIWGYTWYGIGGLMVGGFVGRMLTMSKTL